MKNKSTELGSAVAIEERPFEWAGHRFVTSHTPPRDADLLEGVGVRGMRRVAIMGDYQMEQKRTNSQYDHATTWLYNEGGTLDGDQTGEWVLRQRA